MTIKTMQYCNTKNERSTKVRFWKN